MATAKYEEDISFGGIQHSCSQLQLLNTRPKFLKDYQAPVSFQNLCYGLSSLVTHELCLPVVRYSASFLIHLDDYRDDLVYCPPETLKNFVMLCANLLSSHSAHETLLCETLHTLYKTLEKEIEEPFDGFLRYVLMSQHEELKQYLSNLPSIARLSTKIKPVFKKTENHKGIIDSCKYIKKKITINTNISLFR